MNTNAGVGVRQELLGHQAQPLVHDLLGGRRPVREAQLGHGNSCKIFVSVASVLALSALSTTFSELLCLVELVRGADQVGHLVVLQQLDVVVHGTILKLNSLIVFSRASFKVKLSKKERSGKITHEVISHLVHPN